MRFGESLDTACFGAPRISKISDFLVTMKACALDPAGAHANIMGFSRKGDKGDRIFWLI